MEIQSIEMYIPIFCILVFILKLKLCPRRLPFTLEFKAAYLNAKRSSRSPSISSN